jgi:uncharacterized protein
LRKHTVQVGISLDGGPESNSKRVTLKGEPTLTAVADKIGLLKKLAPHLFRGILCVVNLDSDPIETLSSLCAHGPPELDLLYPYVTHDHAGDNRQTAAIKLGRWMITAMKYWITHPTFSQVRIRVLEDALQATISQRPKTDWFGPRNISYLVVGTGGNYDLLDHLKVIGGESAHYRDLHRNVHTNSIQEAIAVAGELLTRSGGDTLPTDCIGCKWSTVCAGSHLPTRHSLHRGFNNRSVYCEGLMELLNAAHGEMLTYRERHGDRSRSIA